MAEFLSQQGGRAGAQPKKGDCPTCGEGVYADQPRVHENGAYYHEACLAVGATPGTMSQVDGQSRAKVSTVKEQQVLQQVMEVNEALNTRVTSLERQVKQLLQHERKFKLMLELLANSGEKLHNCSKEQLLQAVARYAQPSLSP